MKPSESRSRGPMCAGSRISRHAFSVDLLGREIRKRPNRRHTHRLVDVTIEYSTDHGKSVCATSGDWFACPLFSGTPASLNLAVGSVSLLMIALNCAGVSGGNRAVEVSFSTTSGISETWAMSWLTLVRTAGGFGRRQHAEPRLIFVVGTAASAMVGTSGSWGARLSELMAMARTLPAALSSLALGMARNTFARRPDHRGGRVRHALVGTWTMLILAPCLKISADRNEVLATPADEN